jgi:hypothetical protein
MGSDGCNAVGGNGDFVAPPGYVTQIDETTKIVTAPKNLRDGL